MQGLSSKEVEDRRTQGLVNNAKVQTSRSYGDIVVKNVATPLNLILFLLGAILLVLNKPESAISATGIIIFNIIISTIQEMRAKRRLDRIALLTRPKATVIRDGNECVIDQAEIVKDDIIVLRAGEQALVDGDILESRSLEMDESLLTGESSTVRRKAGDQIYSGSICVTGEAVYRVTSFGNDSYASRMLSSARTYTTKKTPLQMETSSITGILLVIGFVLMILASLAIVIRGGAIIDGTTFEVFVIALEVVPVALFLLITLTYMIAAVRMASSGVLLQRSNSVESISHVDTVCMDKTGTITTNKLLFDSAIFFEDQKESEHLVSLFATATGSKNKTVTALLKQYGESECELLEEVQFSSARKFSAVRVKDASGEHCIYTGAWNVLRPHCSEQERINTIIREQSLKGLRTVVICTSDTETLFNGDEPLIGDLTPFAVISIVDEVRPDCRETIGVFLENDMDIKVISGDDPVTVDALFTIADIPGTRKIVTGDELDALSGKELEDKVLETNIFGRMKPENKEKVIDILKNNGRYVAMIGDGVNDVKSLRTAHVGISLESGSGAARGVSDMILVGDNFAALPKALIEGRKTVTGMRDILRLYLTRNFAIAVIFIATFFIVGSIPMLPIQNLFYAFISVSVAAFFMTFFSKPDKNKSLILPTVLKYSIPSALIISVCGLFAYLLTWNLVDSGTLVIDFEYIASLPGLEGMDAEQVFDHLSWNGSGVAEFTSRTVMVLFLSFAGLLQLVFISPWFKIFSMDGTVNRSLVPPLVMALMIGAVVAMILFFPGYINVLICRFVVLPGWMYLAIVGMIAAWFVIEWAMLKFCKFERMTEFFNRWYLKKLDKEYSKGDVVDH